MAANGKTQSILIASGTTRQIAQENCCNWQQNDQQLEAEDKIQLQHWKRNQYQ